MKRRKVISQNRCRNNGKTKTKTTKERKGETATKKKKKKKLGTTTNSGIKIIHRSSPSPAALPSFSHLWPPCFVWILFIGWGGFPVRIISGVTVQLATLLFDAFALFAVPCNSAMSKSDSLFVVLSGGRKIRGPPVSNPQICQDSCLCGCCLVLCCLLLSVRSVFCDNLESVKRLIQLVPYSFKRYARSDRLFH